MTGTQRAQKPPGVVQNLAVKKKGRDKIKLKKGEKKRKNESEHPSSIKK